MIAVIDSGVGNLRSVVKALDAVGADVTLTADPQTILSAQKVILPGVGAFADTMQGLRERNLLEVVNTIYQRQTPMLGICVGMQVLFDIGEEMGFHAGLGFLPGRVKRFESDAIKVPQTGWNQIEPQRETPLFQGIEPGSYVYFNHSYFCDPVESADILAVTAYGERYASAVQRQSLYGVQFHPEKSQQVGLTILRNFVERC
ncbi:MAG: imidazole glycerol phosphate synthase subunit HisH [Candidatus Promineifilaceae bacterium]